MRNDYISHGGMKDINDVTNELVKFFNYDEPVRLQFTSQNWYWNAYIEGPIELDKDRIGFWSFKVNVVLTDPYKYAVEGTKTQQFQTKLVQLIQVQQTHLLLYKLRH